MKTGTEWRKVVKTIGNRNAKTETSREIKDKYIEKKGKSGGKSRNGKAKEW